MLTEEGIRSAVMAVERTNCYTYDHITFQSKVTHSLQVHIFALKRRASREATRSCYESESCLSAFSPVRHEGSSLRFDSYDNRSNRQPQYWEPSTIETDHCSSGGSFDSYHSPFDLSSH